ncbi:uncharacterized protein Tco_0545057, partial [Tanacetum coccineum]
MMKPEFSGDARNVRLGLAADGFNPFGIMIHMAIHLPDEAILGGPIRYRWMFPFERYMKKLKNYVRNKAKPEGSIAEGYVAEEALTFCSRYLKDDVETRFNRLGRNDDGLPEEEPNKFQ